MVGGIERGTAHQDVSTTTVRRVMIPKPGGGERPLGIPTIRDRVVQTAAKLVLEPIFEADLEPNAYGYRPKRSAQDAIKEVHELSVQGLHRCGGRRSVEVLRYHSARRTDAFSRAADRRPRCLRLIKTVAESAGRRAGREGKRRMTGGKKSSCGTPQGGVISPLLANLYMNRFLKYWRNQNREKPSARTSSTMPTTS